MSIDHKTQTTRICFPCHNISHLHFHLSSAFNRINYIPTFPPRRAPIMANQGESNGYYNMNESAKYAPPQGQPPNGQQQQYEQYQQNQANYNGQQQYSQAPPQYAQQTGPNHDAFAGGEKPTFQQAFKIDKPKFNDWWAGFLLLAVFAGFVVVSAISLQGYGMTICI